MQAQPYSQIRFNMPTTPLANPNCDSPVIAVYRRIAYVSESMREAALGQNWDELIVLGKDYLAAVKELRAYRLDLFSPEEKQARTQLLLEIIDNDALIRDLAQPELARVGRLISRFARGKAAIKAYQQPGTSDSQ